VNIPNQSSDVELFKSMLEVLVKRFLKKQLEKQRQICLRRFEEVFHFSAKFAAQQMDYSYETLIPAIFNNPEPSVSMFAVRFSFTDPPQKHFI
jgi:hypothetical protein